ncbi:MAG: hypothetical protein ACRD1K_15025 [Acidimicrobiales bacterium]
MNTMVGTSDTVFAPLTAAPWIDYLDGLASLMVTRDCDTPRAIVALPTVDLAGAVAAAASARHLGGIRAAVPLPGVGPDDAGCRVSAFTSGAYRDATLTVVTGETVSVGGTTLTRYTDVVRRLPDRFPTDRPRRRLDESTVAAWSIVAGSANPYRVHARVSATPVVVIGHHRPFTADVAELGAIWPWAHDVTDCHHDIDRWFRHPVLVLEPGVVPPEWVAHVTPSLVVVVGAAAWRSPLRHALWGAPHLLLLDRRSAAAVDLVDDICLTNPPTCPLPLTPPPGIEAWAIKEIAPTAATLADPDEEDLF